MIPELPGFPASPRWRLDWNLLEEAHPWVRALNDCPQDPVHHAEGNVGIHTRMVCEELVGLSSWRKLRDWDRCLVFMAALMHDIAKPVSTRVEADGRITARGHSGRGENMARVLLWEQGLPFSFREQVAALIRWHQVPFFAIERESPARLLHEISQTARCDLLALVAEADARGRVCHDKQRLLDNIALFTELCDEQQCLTGPRQFPSEHSRFLYFRKPSRDPGYHAHDDTRCDVVVMSGLPGAGKDHWLRSHRPDLPVVSLDQIREELDEPPTGAQGRVIATAVERAREHLRAGEDFAWSATNLSRGVRSQCVDLLSAYNARVHVVYVEVPERVLVQQNRERPRAIPQPALQKLYERWSVPDVTEAHRVDLVIRERDES
ncbi:MAG: AAA family ATPase [Myxococcota bacterium]